MKGDLLTDRSKKCVIKEFNPHLKTNPLYCDVDYFKLAKT